MLNAERFIMMESRDMKGSARAWVSRRALLPLGRAQRWARRATRPAMRAFYDGMRFRLAAESWSDDERRAWVLARLRESVRRAARETTYYKELFARVGFDPRADFGFDDFARLPVLEREDVAAAGRALISEAVEPAQLRRDATGGSTGVPTEVWLGPEERGWRESGLEYSLARAGVPTGVATGFFWGHHLDPIARSSWRERFHDFESNCRWFDCFRLSPEVFENYHREFEAWRPACIIAYASALGLFAEHLRERAVRPNYPTRCFVTGAEKLLPRFREAIEEVFGRPVHERYGGRDVGLMAFQYEPWRTLDYEVDWSCVLVEPETEDADASSILVTKLHGDGMPMLRYRVGDVARFTESSRPGHPALALREVVGRATDRVWLPNGGWIDGIQLPHLLKDYAVREFMLFQRADYSVELRLVPKNGFAEESRRRVHETVAANLPGLDLSVVLVESIPRTKANKWRPVVSEVQPKKSDEASVSEGGESG
jgi:phenylacetate-CoA ligase